MTRFTFSTTQANTQYIQITAMIETPGDETLIELPAWRPGRYELGNFARLVKSFKVFNEQGELIASPKISKDTWKVNTATTQRINVQYLFYANVLNAGSTYLDDRQLYVNPVNCCVYTSESFNKAVRVKLMVPENWQVATSLFNDGEELHASNMEELFDSPFIASGQLQHNSYQVGDTLFHLWFNGEVKVDWERIIHDFKAFTEDQVKHFMEFPVKEYHFLNQIVPFKQYHGVEHLRSTVIALGPSYDIFGEVYKDLLGVSSHELYHAWNVKAIRPIELFPYNYKSENYSPLGYICEGVTTYIGDLSLFRSGIFDERAYLKEMNTQLQKHFDNPGRFNYSVAESSIDTWLDGYEPGVPGRKVSIYTEGCLLAFVTDIRLRQASNNKYGIDEVMKRLYHQFALENKGVSEHDYRTILEQITGSSWADFFKDFVHGNKPYESILTEAFDYLGLELDHCPSDSYAEAKLGLKTQRSGKEYVVKALYPGGPAETAGLMLDDALIAVNGYTCDADLDKWLRHFDAEIKTLTLIRAGRILDYKIPEVSRNFYMKYTVKRVQQPNDSQRRAFDAWSK